MTAALDLGSSEFRSLRRDEHRLIAQRIPAVYTVVPDHSANRKVLDQSNVPYSTAVDALVVIGEEAIEVSTLLSRPLIPILPQGQLAENDPIARQVSAWLIEMLLPPASSNSASCAISLPRGAVSPAP